MILNINFLPVHLFPSFYPFLPSSFLPSIHLPSLPIYLYSSLPLPFFPLHHSLSPPLLLFLFSSLLLSHTLSIPSFLLSFLTFFLPSFLPLIIPYFCPFFQILAEMNVSVLFLLISLEIPPFNRKSANQFFHFCNNYFKSF